MAPISKLLTLAQMVLPSRPMDMPQSQMEPLGGGLLMRQKSVKECSPGLGISRSPAKSVSRPGESRSSLATSSRSSAPLPWKSWAMDREAAEWLILGPKAPSTWSPESGNSSPSKAQAFTHTYRLMNQNE